MQLLSVLTTHMYIHTLYSEGGDIRDPHTRRAVSLMDRADLEDKHLKIMEENLVMKKV